MGILESCARSSAPTISIITADSIDILQPRYISSISYEPTVDVACQRWNRGTCVRSSPGTGPPERTILGSSSSSHHIPPKVIMDALKCPADPTPSLPARFPSVGALSNKSYTFSRIFYRAPVIPLYNEHTAACSAAQRPPLRYYCAGILLCYERAIHYITIAWPRVDGRVERIASTASRQHPSRTFSCNFTSSRPYLMLLAHCALSLVASLCCY